MPAAPDALLLVSSTCPHCPAVLAALASLVKQGVIGRLEVVNVASHPEIAEALGVRGVPWMRIGSFELEGLHSEGELRTWAGRAGSRQGMQEYLREQLAGGQLDKVLALVRRDDALLELLPAVLADPRSDLPVRVGISAIFEEFQGHARLAGLVEALGALTRHADAHLRADAAHLLSLTGSRNAVPWLEALRHDENAQVREVAIEALEKPSAGGN
jgi:thiol-disulfide isomerase/thioredoxin